MSIDKHLVKSLPSHGDPKDGKGCATKCYTGTGKSHHGNYREQGYQTTKGDSEKRKIYERDFTKPGNAKRLPKRVRELPLGDPFKGRDRLPKDPRTDGDAWKFQGENYRSGYLPFNHNYHHILPWDVIKDTLSSNEVDALQLATYNLNEGRNLIILPETETYALALGLWTHPDNHPTYTQDLKSIVNEAKQTLNPKRGHKITKKNASKFKKMFEDWEDDEWKVIAEDGEANTQSWIVKSIDDHTPSKMTTQANNAK